MKAVGGHPAHNHITQEMVNAVQARYDQARSYNTGQQKKGKKGKTKGGWRQQAWQPKAPNDGKGHPPAAGSGAAAAQFNRQQQYPNVPPPNMNQYPYNLPSSGQNMNAAFQYPAVPQPVQNTYTDVNYQQDTVLISNPNVPQSAITAAKMRIKAFLDKQGAAPVNE